MSAPVDSQNQISLRVVEAIADATRTDPLAIDPPLYDEVDPDALDNLFETDATFRIQFSYDGYEVEVRSGVDGAIDVSVRDADDR